MTEPNGQRISALCNRIADRLDPECRFGNVNDEVRDKLVPEELSIAAAGPCVEQTACGMPWTSYCKQPAAPRALASDQRRPNGCHLAQHEVAFAHME